MVVGSVVYSNRYKCNVGFYGAASNSFSNYRTTKPSSGSKNLEKILIWSKLILKQRVESNKYTTHYIVEWNKVSSTLTIRRHGRQLIINRCQLTEEKIEKVLSLIGFLNDRNMELWTLERHKTVTECYC